VTDDTLTIPSAGRVAPTRPGRLFSTSLNRAEKVGTCSRGSRLPCGRLAWAVWSGSATPDSGEHSAGFDRSLRPAYGIRHNGDWLCIHSRTEYGRAPITVRALTPGLRREQLYERVYTNAADRPRSTPLPVRTYGRSWPPPAIVGGSTWFVAGYVDVHHDTVNPFGNQYLRPRNPFDVRQNVVKALWGLKMHRE
jgi:hypothetical protein